MKECNRRPNPDIDPTQVKLLDCILHRAFISANNRECDMTNFDWAKLGVKLTGLWLMISSLRSVTNVIEAVYINRPGGMPIPFALAVSALSPLAAGLIGLYLWLRTDVLASSIFPRASELDRSSVEDQEHWVPVALSLMGIWLVTEAIPTLVHSIALSIFSLPSASQSVFGPIDPAPIMRRAKADSLAALARAFIGVGLILGRRRLAEVISDRSKVS
jgi:hypothetical protein